MAGDGAVEVVLARLQVDLQIGLGAGDRLRAAELLVALRDGDVVAERGLVDEVDRDGAGLDRALRLVEGSRPGGVGREVELARGRGRLALGPLGLLARGRDGRR